MKSIILILTGVAWIGLGSLSCSKKQQDASRPAQKSEPASEEPVFYADNVLPDGLENFGIKRLGTVHKIMPADADSSLGSKAEEYLSYDLVGMAMSEYEVDGFTVSANVSQFASLEDAYGFYATLRPVGIGAGGLGAESFSKGKATYFTQGEFVVAVTSAEQDSAHEAARQAMAQQISSHIASPPIRPQFFMLFPMADMIALSNRYFPHGFLDVAGLDKVYTLSYLAGGDTAVLFLTMDESGERFGKLQDYAASTGKVSPAPKSIPFDEYSVMFRNPDGNRIVAGLVRSKLVGIIGYDSTSNYRLISMWVKGLK